MIWLLLAAAVLTLASIGWLVRHRRPRDNSTAQPWTRQDQMALASLVSGALLGAGGLLVPVLTTEDPPPEPPTGPEVAALSVVGATESKPGPALNVQLRNTSNDISFITQVRVTIEDADPLIICEPGGHEETSFTYPLQLPLDPAPGQVLAQDISQSIAPNTVDKFELRTSLEAFDELPTAMGLPIGQMVYLVDVALIHDGGQELTAGRAVLVVPVRREYVQPDDFSSYLLDFAHPCYDENARVIAEAQETDAARPAALDQTRLP